MAKPKNTLTACCPIETLPANSSSIPIGHPVANTRVYVLDAQRQLVPIAVPGELCVGGEGLARGYRNRPGLTAERFVQNPFHGPAGSRLFCTGDIGRWMADGTLQFLERLNQPLKLPACGSEELSEVEAVLNENRALEQTVVTMREDIPDDKRLVAYCVAAAGELRDEVALDRYLHSKLPAYMVPSAYVFLDALPLSSDGQIDRDALPAPSAPAHEFAAPETETEQRLGEMFEQLLNVQRVGRHDDFFELGGHSLLIVRLAAKIVREFKTTLPLTSIIQARTLEQLAAVIDQQREAQAAGTCRSAGQGEVAPALVCLNFGPKMATALGEEYPVLSLRMEPDEISSYTDVKSIAGYAVEQLRALQPNGPYMLSGYCGMGVVAFEMAQQLVTQEERVDLLALIDVTDVGHVGVRARDSIASRVFRHLARLSQLRMSEWPSYIRKRLNGLRDMVMVKIPWLKAQPRHNWVYVHQAVSSYPYEPKPYSGKIVFFVSEDRAKDAVDPTHGWQDLAQNGAQVCIVPGDHFTLINDGNLETLVSNLKTFLAQVRTKQVNNNAGRQVDQGVGRPQTVG